jgi:hypothetical protein
VSSESDKPHLPLFPGLLQRFRGATFPDEQGRIVFETRAVDLPKVQMIGSQPVQRFVEHAQRKRLVSPVRTQIGHQEHAIAHSL